MKLNLSGRTLALFGSLWLAGCGSGELGATDGSSGTTATSAGAGGEGSGAGGSGDSSTASGSGGMASTSTGVGGGPGGLIWPNAMSSANSDPWLTEHHDEITEMHPRALIINFANGVDPAKVKERWAQMADAMSEMSRYHGYSDPSVKPFVVHEVLKIVDIIDTPIPAGWTAPNSTKMPRLNGGIDFAGLYTQEFADLLAIKDPKNASHNMTLCELLQSGTMNELFIAFNKTGSDLNVPEIIEYKQQYDDQDHAIPGKFDPYAGNGWFEPADLPAAKACGRSLRVDFLEMTGGLSGAMHVLTHNFEHLDGAVPNIKKFYFPLLNFDFDTRFNTPFRDWYGIAGGGGAMSNFVKYTGDNKVDWTCPMGTSCYGMSGTMDPYDQGCGNTHFAPNSRNSYDMTNTQKVRTRCEHYGLHDGPDGKDLTTLWDPSVVDALAAKYGKDGNGGGWQVYLMQSFPGFGNKATMPDGTTKIKNFWPYLYY